MCPGPLSWLCPPFPWGHQRSTQGQHCRCSWTVRRGHWGKFPAEFLSPSPGLASGQENPPWRVWQRWLEEPRSSGEVQEQGCTSHISRCPAQVLPGQRDSLITLSFSHEGNVFQGKTQTKKKKKKTKLPAQQKSGKHLQAKPQSHGKCWVSSALSKHSLCCTNPSQPRHSSVSVPSLAHSQFTAGSKHHLQLIGLGVIPPRSTAQLWTCSRNLHQRAQSLFPSGSRNSECFWNQKHLNLMGTWNLFHRVSEACR